MNKIALNKIPVELLPMFNSAIDSGAWPFSYEGHNVTKISFINDLYRLYIPGIGEIRITGDKEVNF